MDFSSDTLYQIVRILFAASLLGFLFLVIRTTMKELHQPLSGSIELRPQQPRAELITLPCETSSTVADGVVFDIQGVTAIGRAQSARVILDDTSISAQHALLRPIDGNWTIEDLGSRNGTMVNGRLIAGAAQLQCGDSIQLGRVRLRLMC